MTAFMVDIRDRRQVTVPKAILANLGLTVGDKLLFDLDGKQVRVRPVVEKINDTLKAVSKAFKEAKITEKELLDSGEMIREELFNQKYGIKE